VPHEDLERPRADRDRGQDVLPCFSARIAPRVSLAKTGNCMIASDPAGTSRHAGTMDATCATVRGS